MKNFDTNQDAYQSLRNIIGERTKPVVAWVGAGLSMSAGLPSWGKLKAKLVEALVQKAEGMPEVDRRAMQNQASASKQMSAWLAFDTLREELGRATYREIIRTELAPAVHATVPNNYNNLWRLRLAGIINLNLDRLATRAHNNIKETTVTEFDGSQVGSHMHVLNSIRPFICNLHGTIENVDSWVFTNSDLKRLMVDAAYNLFIKACLASHTVLFIGLSADDVAVGGHLTSLFDSGIDVGSHYWITDRTDRATDRRAEQMGIRIIRYDASGDDHSALNYFFEDLLSFVPQEPTSAEPVTPSITNLNADVLASSILPEPFELTNRSADSVREILNGEAKRLLQRADGVDFSEYQQFLEKYDEAVYKAWYVNAKPGTNNLMGYSLLSECARGAFGKVYQAQGPDGDLVAVKLLLEEIRNNPEVVNSFRRGVRSMHILKENGVQRMVAYREAAEIPAFVVMDWVDGPSLKSAVQAQQLNEWPIILKVGIEIADVLRTAHALPARVLHRDVRPSNIMLKGFYTEPDGWYIVVLDFDLSWHRGAEERSVTHGSTTLGYLAPEQTRYTPGASTRNAAVDSYGLGMTLYHVISRLDPMPSQHQHVSWPGDVHRVAQRVQGSQWYSLAERFKRIILNATLEEQPRRWDMTQIYRELVRLDEANKDGRKVVSAELLAEELAARTFEDRPYEWDDNHLTATVHLASGVTVGITGLESAGRVKLSISWTNSKQHEHKKVARWISPAAQRAVAQLQKAQWSVQHQTIDSTNAINIDALRSVQHLRSELDQQSALLNDVVSSLQLS